MKNINYSFLLMCWVHSVAAQTDYTPHPDFISGKSRTLIINWIITSPEKCVIDFNHFVEFHNLKGDILTPSRVQVVLYKNANPVRSYLFPTGSGILNRIYVPAPVPLKKGDALYFVFTLLPESESEEYVFNIFQSKKEPGVLPHKKQSLATRHQAHNEMDDEPQQTKTALAVTQKQKPTRQRIGGKLKQEARREKVNRTMTNVTNIIDFLL